MKKVVKKTTEKYVTESTFEKHMRNIAGSFARVDASLERHEEVLKNILEELKNLHEDHKYIKQTLSSFTGDVSRHDYKIESLNVRVEKIESKSK